MNFSLRRRQITFPSWFFTKEVQRSDKGLDLLCYLLHEAAIPAHCRQVKA